MPYADSAATARRWAQERSIALWTLFAGDLSSADLEALGASFAAARADGALLALIVPRGRQPTGAEQALADLAVDGPAAPVPFGLFCALQAAGLSDIRRLGVLGARPAALDAGHRAGAGAIVGLAPADPEARRPLLEAQPDVIVAPGDFASLDRARYAGDRAHRQRVL